MPKRVKTEQKVRLMKLLEVLPLEGKAHGLGPAEIASRMASIHGIEDYRDAEGTQPGTGEKRLQRDLNELEALFGSLVFRDTTVRSRPLFWKTGSLHIPSLDAHGALALKIAGEHLRQILPPATYEQLENYLSISRHALRHLSSVASWENKVRVLPAGQPRIPPAVNRVVQTLVQQALFENRRLSLRYRKKGEVLLTDYPELHPAALVVRGPACYLVAFKPDDPQPRQFALHRIDAAERLFERAQVPADFSIDRFIEEGEPGFVVCDHIIDLELRMTLGAADHLRESPLAAGQEIEMDAAAQEARVKVRLPWTYELEWWLLGFGEQLEIVAPDALRERIATAHRRAAARYVAAASEAPGSPR